MDANREARLMMKIGQLTMQVESLTSDKNGVITFLHEMNEGIIAPGSLDISPAGIKKIQPKEADKADGNGTPGEFVKGAVDKALKVLETMPEE